MAQQLMDPRCASDWSQITIQLCKLPVGLCKLPVKLTMLEGLKGQKGFLVGSLPRKHPGIIRQVGSQPLQCLPELRNFNSRRTRGELQENPRRTQGEVKEKSRRTRGLGGSIADSKRSQPKVCTHAGW